VETLLLSSLNAVFIYITESLYFKTVKQLKLGVNYSGYNMAHAEPDTSSMGF